MCVASYFVFNINRVLSRIFFFLECSLQLLFAEHISRYYYSSTIFKTLLFFKIIFVVCMFLPHKKRTIDNISVIYRRSVHYSEMYKLSPVTSSWWGMGVRFLVYIRREIKAFEGKGIVYNTKGDFEVLYKIILIHGKILKFE